MKEPKKAFPYKPPSDDLKKAYSYIFYRHFLIKQKYLKLTFDKIVAIIFLIIASPIIILLKIAFVIEGIIIPENKGPMFFSYNALSQWNPSQKYIIFYINQINL